MTVPFHLRNGRYGNYSQFQLLPGKREVFRNTTEILVKTTNGNAVSYWLTYGNRYKIYWNPAATRWDVSTITENL